MDKRAFIKAVRNWESRTVETAVANDHSLARQVDKIGKTPLHHCAEIDPKKFRLRVSDSIAKALLDAGADVNAVRIIMDDGEEGCASDGGHRPFWQSHSLQ